MNEWDRFKNARDSRRLPVHVVPVNDLREHLTGATMCWCKPKIQQHEGYDPVVVHNSEDGRELIERNGIN